MGALAFSLLSLGFLMGMKHAFEADHIAAVSAIAAKSTSMKKSYVLGIFWGIGHTIALLAVALIALSFRTRMPVKVAASLELIAALMLVLLGVNILVTIKKSKIHAHRHKHGKEAHFHFHSHISSISHTHLHRQSLFIGILHGLAGSAALTLILLSTIESAFIGIIYVLIFGAGSILGMSVISSVISLPFSLIPKKLNALNGLIKVGTSLFSISVGMIMIKMILF